MGRSSLGDGVTVRLSEDARKCVVFFGVSSPDGEDGIQYGGTGTLIGLIDETDGHFGFAYLVTNRHIAERLSNDTGFYIRANRKDGTAFPIPIESLDWSYPGTGLSIWRPRHSCLVKMITIMFILASTTR